MKTTSEHLDDRRADRRAEYFRRRAGFMLMASIAITLALLIAFAVVRTAQIVGDTMARCDAQDAVCAAPAW